MRSPNQTKSQIIWVTGASSGLGRSLVLLLSDLGHQVIASARDVKALHDLQLLNSNIDAIPCDIEDESSLADAQSKIKDKFSAIDRLF